jgi:nicotinic acid mononucleotide adenylyltransferase
MTLSALSPRTRCSPPTRSAQRWRLRARRLTRRTQERISIVPQTVFNNISSTTVREHLRRGLSVRYLVPDAVVDFLEKTQLYRGSRL